MSNEPLDIPDVLRNKDNLIRELREELAQAKAQSASRGAELKAEALEEAAQICSGISLYTGNVCAEKLSIKAAEYRAKVKPLGEKP